MGAPKLDVALAAATMPVASSVAAAHPESMLPCPACGASTKGRNLVGHVEKVHPDVAAADSAQEAPTSWRGRRRLSGLGARLRLESNHLDLRHSFGLGHRRVALPAPLLAAGLEEKKSYSHSPGSEYPAYSTWTEKAGTYLQFGENRRKSIRVGTHHGAGVRKHWDGAGSGTRRRGWHVTVPGPAFVSLQYALAQRGVLTPR